MKVQVADSDDSYVAKLQWTAQQYQELAAYLTKLWEKRGISWHHVI